MAPSKTRTIKNKHAGAKTSGGAAGSGAKRSATDGVSKSRKPKGTPPSQQLKEKNRAALLKKPKKKIYSEQELGIPKLNTITPVGVVKPRGKKKGKVFVDDRVSGAAFHPAMKLSTADSNHRVLQESMTTILSMVQAEMDGQIESKMIKARQMEEIREARKVEADKKEEERRNKLENTKESLRKKRKRKSTDDDENVKDFSSAGTRAGKPKKKVSFA
ncbi:60S ribosomal subunit assembly/export protein loc1 [Paramyrothecium foliicola]|nr:60S ribosomal subunit assembly/export protein loc1 [Paramyrothecium foliicola]